MTDETYNGWKNYPTWAVNLWLSNDEGLYRETQGRIQAILNECSGWDRKNGTEKVLAADMLKEWVTDDLAPDLGATFAADLLGYALGEVDWYEIAEAWIADAIPA